MNGALLDTCCAGGGAGAGYARAGLVVTGVDIAPQPHYPFTFIQADALAFIRERGREFDAIHASPPCQGYSAMRSMTGRAVARQIPEFRRALESTGRPFIIEGVAGSDLIDPVLLCGTMFGLRVRRHRLFEISTRPLVLTPPCSCKDGVVTGRLIGHRTGGRVRGGRRQPPAHTDSDLRDAIGVPWMPARLARQAIPPAYTEFLARFL